MVLTKSRNYADESIYPADSGTRDTYPYRRGTATNLPL